MMYQRSDFKTAYSEDGALQMLEMPYAGNDLSMVILLPETESPTGEGRVRGLTVLEQELTPENLKAWLARLDEAQPRKTSVYFPKFTVTRAFNLTKTLQQLGLTSAFGMAADFSGMDGTTNLFISDVLHTAFVEVNEAGTEAAAATMGVMAAKAESDYFKADHPFIFLIRDNASGAILFLGRVVDPTQR